MDAMGDGYSELIWEVSISKQLDILKIEGSCHHHITLLKFIIAPEKWWLEDYVPIGKVTFQGLC